MLLVGFHGGSSDDHHVAAYHDDGELVAAKVLHPDPKGLEPRALGMVGPRRLWLVNSSKEKSAILSFTGAGAKYERTGAPVTCADADSLRHPFDYTFSQDGKWCWVSNQDTNVVARFAVDAGSLAPAPTAPALPDGTFLDGTFVASSVGKLPDVPVTTTAVPHSEGGLKVRISGGKVVHSVRGVVAVGGVLYVADEPGDAVKAYDAGTGAFLGASDGIKAPVHLLAADGALYASGKDGVFYARLDAGKLSFHRVLKLDGASGMAFGKGHHFYVANRLAQTVSGYHHFSPESPGNAQTWKVPAAPEFILYLHNGGAR
jgi:hypothetical protein